MERVASEQCPACVGYGTVYPAQQFPRAVLSTVVLPEDGVYHIETISIESGLSALESHCLHEGPVVHFIGHPATRAIIEDCGAVYAGQGALFLGLKPGEWALAFPIRQGRSEGAILNRAHPLANGLVGAWLFNEGQADRSKGGSDVNQTVRREDLSCRRITRLA